MIELKPRQKHQCPSPFDTSHNDLPASAINNFDDDDELPWKWVVVVGSLTLLMLLTGCIASIVLITLFVQSQTTY